MPTNFSDISTRELTRHLRTSDACMRIYGKVYVCVRCVYTYLHAIADRWAHVHTLLSWLVGRGRTHAVAGRVAKWSRDRGSRDQMVTRSYTACCTVLYCCTVLLYCIARMAKPHVTSLFPPHTPVGAVGAVGWEYPPPAQFGLAIRDHVTKLVTRGAIA